jgi:hypothetical protein
MTKHRRLIVLTLIQGSAITYWLSDHHDAAYLWGMWFGFWLYNFCQNVGKILFPEE